LSSRFQAGREDFVELRASRVRPLANESRLFSGRVACLAEDTVLQFLAGRLSVEQAASVDEHVGSCSTCRQRVRLVARGSPASAEVIAETVLAVGTEDLAMLPTCAELGTALPRELGGGRARASNVGRYVVLDVLGQGGMGVVYAAFDPELDRKVAVKLLRPELAEGGGEAAAARLLREGRAIAKLAHPNVVTVFDVGTHEGAVFVAMELVDGCSLETWIQEKQRPWRDVVAMFSQAGAGLIAAHAAGMVHRDFKPANVLMGNDGRVRVTDFGLARLATSGGAPRRSSDISLATRSGEDVALTRTGAVMGTPAYMAPEQFEAGEIDAKADQFSFAVALYEALYGERPFAGSTMSAILANILDDNVRPPTSTGVPIWLRQIVLRGMRREPDARYPTLEAMLDELRFDPSARRRRIIAGLGLTTTIAGVAMVAFVSAGSSEIDCSRAGDTVSAVWSEPDKQNLSRTLAASGIAGAVPIGARAATLLDDYTAQLRSRRVAACKAHHVDHSRSVQVFDAQMRCLDGRLESTRTLVHTLSTKPDVELVAKAADAVLALPSLSDCDDNDRLLSRHAEPRDAKQREQVKAAEAALARADTLFALGSFDAALALVTEAEALTNSYPVTLARASCMRGNIENSRNLFPAAFAAYERCAEVAAEAGDDAMLGEAWVSAMGIEGFHQGKIESALARAKMAENALTRAGRPKELVARFHFVRGNVRDKAGDLQAALADHEQAHDLYVELGNVRAVAKALNAKAAIYYAQGVYDKALANAEQAARLRKQVYGPMHPDVLASAQNVALILGEMGRREESIEGLELVLAETEAALGNHSYTAQAAHNLAASLRRAGKYERALELHQRGLAIRRAVYGEEHMDTATSYELVGAAQIDLGRSADAENSVQMAIAIARKVLPPDHPDLAFNLYSLTRVYFAQKKFALAFPLIKEVVAIRDSQQPVLKQHLATSLASLGMVAKHLGKWDEACPAFKRAHDLRVEISGPDAYELVKTEIGLAQCAAANLEWVKAELFANRAMEIEGKQKMSSAVSVAATQLDVAAIYRANPKWRNKAIALEALAAKGLASSGEAGAHALEKLKSLRKTRPR
jgi:eukaryotic-like serine/threonine-protein kinase